MQSLNIAEAGFSYIFRCVGYYSEGCSYLLLYVLSLCFLFLKADRRLKRVFLPQALMLLLTIYNPVFPVLLNSIFDVNKEYYRFLWITPVIIVTACAGAVLVYDCAGNAVRRAVTTAALILLMITAGSFVYSGGYVKAENIYQMPSELLQVADILHRDSDTEYLRAMFEYDYHMQIRQYDPTILLPCDRDTYMEAVSGKLDPEIVEEEENASGRLLEVIALGMRIDEEDFREALESTATEYVVISNANPAAVFLTDAGLKLVGTTAGHRIYRYDMKEPQVFQPEDYSGIWELDSANGIQIRWPN